jgi:hypothetical protein
MKLKSLLFIAVLSLLSLQTNAQERRRMVGFEITAGPSVALGKIGDYSVGRGKGIEGIVSFMPMKHFGLFAGWGWNLFKDNYYDFEDNGYMFGLQFKDNIKKSPFSYYLRAGGLYNHIEIEDATPNAVDGFYSDSGHGLGIHLSAGAEFSLGKGWSVNSNLKFQHLTRDVILPTPLRDNVATTVSLNYLALRVGIVKYF